MGRARPARIASLGLALAALGALFVPVRASGGAADRAPPPRPYRPAPVMSVLDGFDDQAPPPGLRLLFVHHSCGGQLFAPPGPVSRERATCIYEAHPNGGNLRAKLAAAGYEVHEASYGSKVGDKTDLFDWLPKLRTQMDDVLAVDVNDTPLAPGVRNQIVVFKSCFPNNDFVSEGAPPGNPNGPELTVWNARATLSALLPELAKHPEVLFVYVTAPAQAPLGPEPAWKWLAKRLTRKGRTEGEHARRAALARAFDTWVTAKDGWLAGYGGTNVAVFDYYDVLTGHGASNLSMYGTGDGGDSHPSAEGNAKAAEAFVPFLNRAVRRAGLAPP